MSLGLFAIILPFLWIEASSIGDRICGQFMQVDNTGCPHSLHKIHYGYAMYQNAFNDIRAAVSTSRVKLCTSPKRNCTVIVCGYDFVVNATMRARMGEEKCVVFKNCDKDGWNVPKMFDISSTHCECEDAKHVCETNCQEKEIYDKKVCAIAYRSPNCQDCDMAGCHFQRGGDYTFHGLEAELVSLKIREGCTLVVQNITQDASKLNITESISNWKLYPTNGITGFECTCLDDKEVMNPEVSEQPSTCEPLFDVCAMGNNKGIAPIAEGVCVAVPTDKPGTDPAKNHNHSMTYEMSTSTASSIVAITTSKSSVSEQMLFLGIYVIVLMVFGAIHFVRTSNKINDINIHTVPIKRCLNTDPCTINKAANLQITINKREIVKSNLESSNFARHLIHSDEELAPWNKKSIIYLGKIGEGSYGLVCRVKDLGELGKGGEFAVKWISIEKTFRNGQQSGERLKEIVNETSILNDLTHENVIRCYETWAEDSKGKIMSREKFERIIGKMEDTNFSSTALLPEDFRCNMFIKMELCQGTLKQWMSWPRERCLHLVTPIFSQLLKGLKFIAGKGYIHRDIKPENIFYKQENPLEERSIIWKIADFGLAIKGSENHKPPCGTEAYKSPEEKSNNLEYGSKSDVYSMGLTMAQVFLNVCGKINSNNCLRTLRQCEDAKTFLHQQVEFKPEFEKVINMLSGMLKNNPNDRLTAASCMTMLEKM